MRVINFIVFLLAYALQLLSMISALVLLYKGDTIMATYCSVWAVLMKITASEIKEK
jgi:hypothetical protein